MNLFSQRHRENIEKCELPLDVPANIKLKLIDCMKRYNSWEGTALEDSLFFGKLKEILLKNLEIFPQKFYVEDTMRKAGMMDQFMLDVKTEYLFDSMELYVRLIDPFRRDLFQEECSHILRSEKLPFKFEAGYVSHDDPQQFEGGSEYGFLSAEPIKRVIRFFC